MPMTPENLQVSAPQQKEQDIDMLDTIKKSKGQGSKEPTKSVLEIIKEDAARHGVNPDELLKKLATMKMNPNVKTVQIGNTVFLLIQVEPNVVEAHSFTAETPQGLMENFKSLAMFLKKNGIKKGYTYSDQPAFKRLAQSSGMNVQVSQTVKKMGKDMKPVFMYSMEF
jgi:hypothetical protein